MGTLFVRLSAVLPALLLRWSAVAMTGGALLGTMPVLAQSYPTKPIRLIVPYPPGGTTDFVAKFNAELNRALANPGVIQRLLDQGVEATPGTPAAFRELIVAETERWRTGEPAALLFACALNEQECELLVHSTNQPSRELHTK